MDNERLVKMVENSQRYAKALEDIIERIDMADQTRILVNTLVEKAKKESDMCDERFINW